MPKHTRNNYIVTYEKKTNNIVQKNTRVKKTFPQKNIRPIEPPKKAPPVLPEQTEKKVETEIIKIEDTPKEVSFDYYLGFGGTGDAVLVLAACYKNPKSYIVFFANTGSLPFVKDLFKLYNIPSTVMANVMGQPIANMVFNRLKKLLTFKQSAHLADGLDYEDWRNEEKYIPRIVNHIPEWRSKFGLLAKNLIAISPSGSTRDISRQRYLKKSEYETLVRKYLAKGYEVYGIGSDRDCREYFFQEKGHWWTTRHFLRDCNNQSTSHSLEAMLRIINTATEVISMDTWLKTYSLIAGIPTTVVATRWNGVYKPYGSDVTDCIFLNKKIWPSLKVAQIEDLLI